MKVKINPGCLTIVNIFFSFLLLMNNMAVQAQTKKWQELRSFTYGANSYSNNTIYTLGEDYNMQILYAPVGKEVFRWKGGNSSWEHVGASAPLQANGSIFTVTADAQHNVYAAGYFDNAQGKYYVAKAAWNKYTFNSEGWAELGGVNSLKASGPIYSVAADAAGNVYAGGSFISTATGYRYIAKWDGSNWSETGTGAAALKANSYIYSICVDGNNVLYAAGAFTDAAGSRYVAKWNGSSWSQLGNAFAGNGDIRAIVADGKGYIYAAGKFYNAAGKNYVAKWNGSSWQELTGLNASSDIYALSTDGVNIYAGGDFSNATGGRYVAKWDGSSWSETGAASPLGANNTIYATAADATGKVFAGGDFVNHNNFNYVSHCSAATNGWVETGPNGTGSFDATNMYSIAANVKGDTVYASGCLNNGGANGYVAKWDGQQWAAQGLLNAANCISPMLTDQSGHIYVAGAFDGFYRRYIMAWNGQSWSDPGNSKAYFSTYGQPELMKLDASGNLYCTGPVKGSPKKYFVAKWDGLAWAELGTGSQALNSDEPLSGLWVDKTGNVFVCCYKYFNWHIAKWNGSVWTFLESAPGSADISLDQVSMIFSDQAGNVYSNFTNWSGSYLRKWDGQKWTIINSAGVTGGIVIDKKDNWFVVANGSVHRWDGQAWQRLGTEGPAEFTAYSGLYSDNNQYLYVVGKWKNGTPAIARYDYRNLSYPLISGVSGKCADAATARGKLYNPVSPDSMQLFQDGRPLAYRAADSSFEYFTKGAVVTGSHTIMATYTVNGVRLADSISYRVNSVTVPVISLSVPSPFVCMSAGFTINCISNVPVSSWQWYVNYQISGAATDSLLSDALQPNYPKRTYYCKVTLPANANYCYSVYQLSSDTLVMQAGNSLPPPAVAISSDDADLIICNQQTVKFTATASGEGNTPVYQWRKNGKVTGSNSKVYQTDSLANGDRIIVSVTNNSYCLSQPTGSSNTITINKDTVALRIPDSLIRVCATPAPGLYPGITGQAGYTYKWISQPAGFVSDQANPLLSPLATTVYQLTRTNIQSGCIAAAAITVAVDATCAGKAVLLYPNPSNGYFTVVLTTPDLAGSTLEVISVSGSRNYTVKLERSTNPVDLRPLPNGSYGYRVVKNNVVIQNGKFSIVH